MKVSAQYAQEHFVDILSAADNGEEVEIARPDKPTLFLAPRPVPAAEKRPLQEWLGAWEGRGIKLPTDEEWSAMDKEIEDEMVNGPIFPSDHA